MCTSSWFAVAVEVLTILGLAEVEAVRSEHVACSVNTNPVVIRRILCALGRAGLVTSQTGAAGGSRLARRPDRITLREVYRAVEPPSIFSLHRQPPSRECLVGMNIESVLEDVLGEVDGAIDQVLGRITLERVMRSVRRCDAAARRRR